jgi:phage shock protein A
MTFSGYARGQKSMGLWQRLGQLVLVEFKAKLRSTQPPERVLIQTVEQLQDHQLQLRLVLAQAIATHKRCQRQQQQAASLADYWQYQARLALEQIDESLSRSHLTRWQAYRANAQSLAQQLQQQQELITQLQTLNRALELRLRESRIRKDLLIARAQGLETILEVQQVLAELDSPDLEQEWLKMMDNAQRMQSTAQGLSDQEDRLERQWSAVEGGVDGRSPLGQIHQA